MPALPRYLQVFKETSRPRAQQAYIRVGCGFSIDLEMPVVGNYDASRAWSLKETFEIRDPWTQRSLIELTTNLDQEDMLVVRQWNWMIAFRDWLLFDQNTLFPARYETVSALAAQFAETGQFSGYKYLWFKDDDVVAMEIVWQVDFHDKEPNNKKTLAYKRKWDDYFDKHNRAAPSQAKGLFHVSSLWVQAEVLNELIDSTVSTLMILLVLAFLGMLIFTRSFVLSLWVVFATVCVVLGLAFFVVIVMGWSVGLIEGIALIYFIGYAVTYSLHIAHSYAGKNAVGSLVPPEYVHSSKAVVRFQRTGYALRSIGGAAVGSSVTTAGASSVLVFGTLTVFRKLGVMCLAVSVLSIIMALGPLPAALFIIGPTQPGCSCSCGRTLLQKSLIPSSPWVLHKLRRNHGE